VKASSGDFVLPVDKPEGPTSHDIVGAARKGIGTRRVGHTGTLDPFASGLLLLCIGKATRLAEYLTGMDKPYEAVARLGIRTDTLDREGTVESETPVEGLGVARVGGVLATFAGDLLQVPPQYSAKKVDGEAMHHRARRGEHVELEPCAVTVHDITLLSCELPDVRFSVRCSSGTYIRSLARDLGEALGTGAHLTSLRRTAIGAFDVEDALTVDDLAVPAAVRAAAIEPLEAIAHFPRLTVDDIIAKRLLQGQRVPMPGAGEAGVRAVAHEGALLAIAELRDGVLGPRKVFAG